MRMLLCIVDETPEGCAVCGMRTQNAHGVMTGCRLCERALLSAGGAVSRPRCCPLITMEEMEERMQSLHDDKGRCAE